MYDEVLSQYSILIIIMTIMKTLFVKMHSRAYLQVYREGEKEERKRTAKEVEANNIEDAGIVKELGQEEPVGN